ncbi:MAG: bifunctional precorrin-2 dehydrogenase/sirohydrochlorin ferrochelatase [Methanobacterium sp.]|uniref:precorrin-2 dehydrogenase/sirohydrochlorin ferrochelatase family protein n=1 Tax=Methanobacterium sp. TaxID=2164 RepID=UPI003D6488F1|nr:bifunctional precorrin-2 dehydrogenase/sirohydrochlorin ferrochelatase [Methanobacterium sp.]
MGWTPLFLQMENKNVLVVGAGEVGSRRARRFLNADANVIIIGKKIPNDIIEIGAEFKPLEELEKWVEWSNIVVVATNDRELNELAAKFASDKLLNRADFPDEGNLIVPSSFFIGDVQLCIFTGGKSPLMAKELRKKIQKVIKEEDILQLELQNFTRNILKENVNNQKKRRAYLYEILNDENVEKYLKEGNLKGAKEYIKQNLNF